MVHVALRLGVILLARGAQDQEVETSLREVLDDLGLGGAEAVVTNGTISVSYVAPGDAEAITAIRAVRDWSPDFSQLASAAALATAIRSGQADLQKAEAELDRLATVSHPYPHWLRFAAPALLSFAVTILFGGSLGDAVATLAIGLAVQPVLEWIDRSELPHFFQVVTGVSATALLVVLLVKAGVPVEGSLVLTGSLLRFLPAGQLVSGIHDLIAGAFSSGIARMAEVALISAAIAGAASLVLAIGENLDVQLRISASGAEDWRALVLVVAGGTAVVCNAFRFGVPRRAVVSVAGLGAAATIVAQGFTPMLEDLGRPTRTLVAALGVGTLGTLLARRSRLPAAIWTVTAILPLLPPPATLLPLLAESSAAQEALQSQAVETAFAIGVGVASGSIAVATYQRNRARLLKPVTKLSGRLARPVSRWRRRSPE